jgi:hypothetical protein
LSAKITTLIEKQDTNEIIRDQIAAILAVEVENQRQIAIAELKDPDDFSFLVFVERSRPWESDEMPLVNVLFDNDRFDNKGSDVTKEQKATGTFYLDCYGNKAADETNTGDELASKEVDRIARLVRNIIMAGEYRQLAFGYRELGTGNNLVFKRYIMRREKFMPNINQDGYENIIACRLTLEVEYKELSPQAVPVDLELMILQCKREDGKVYFTAEYDLTN